MTSVNHEAWTAFLLDVDTASESMEQSLLRLEEARGYDADVLNTLYRALHTFKGIARMMGLPHIEAVAHRSEDLVSVARERQLALPPSDCDLLLACLDFFRNASHRAAAVGHDENESQAAELVGQLNEWAKEWNIERMAIAAEPALLSGLLLFDDEPDDTAVPTSDLLTTESATEPEYAGQPRGSNVSTRAASDTPSPASNKRHSTDEYIRIPSHKIKNLLDLAAEIGLAAHAVTHSPTLQGTSDDALVDAAHALDTLVRELRDTAATLAMVPLGEVFARMKRVVRDVARETGKEIELRISGNDAEVDKSVADRLVDPLLHLLRNAADHGLESGEDREAVGKRRCGLITLDAANLGGEVVIAVSDDGGGLNRERILARAREKGLLPEDADPSDREVWKLIFEPGFSTAKVVSNLSGRGVGMDAVRNSIEALNGAIELESTPGRGTRVLLHLPLSLAFLDGLVFRLGGRAFVFPLDSVSRIYRSPGQEVTTLSGQRSEVVDVDGELTPVCWLDRLYGYRTRERPPLAGRVVVIVKTRRGRLAVPIDDLVGAQQVTMKPLYGVFRHIRAASACGVLSSGAIAIAIDCDKLHDQVA